MNRYKSGVERGNHQTLWKNHQTPKGNRQTQNGNHQTQLESLKRNHQTQPKGITRHTLYSSFLQISILYHFNELNKNYFPILIGIT